MQVEFNNKNTKSLPFLGHVIFGTDDACDVILENNTADKKKCFSIINDKNACVIEIFNQENIKVNNLPVKEMSILHAGDIIHIDGQSLKIIDENRLPQECSIPFKLNKTHKQEDLLTSVSGLRSFNKGSYGELTIIGDQNSFTHKPRLDIDIPFSVSYLNDNLTLLCKKGETIEINGNKANYVILKNGDYISSGLSRFCVESPGTSSFSKYSPSHPRNIQLSEEYVQNTIDTTPTEEKFLKKNLWWIVLIFGLLLIATILFYLKNNQ